MQYILFLTQKWISPECTDATINLFSKNWRSEIFTNTIKYVEVIPQTKPWRKIKVAVIRALDAQVGICQMPTYTG